MTGRRTILGLCMLCALAFSAIAVQGASAKGLRFFTCVPGTGFRTEHCVPGDTGVNYEHVDWFGVTHARFHNEKTNAETNGISNLTFKETIAATNLELESTGVVEAVGEVSNEEVGGEWRGNLTTNASGFVYNGVVVKSPKEKGCKVFEDKVEGGVPKEGAEGVVRTNPVKGHTLVVKDKNEGVEAERHSIIIEPAEAGKALATFWITCEKGKGVPEELEGTWEIKGTLTCPTNGATIVCNHTTVTEQNTLKGKGAKAAIAGKITITAGKFPITEPTHPISLTTIP